MQTKLIPLYQDAHSGKRAESILRSCVHCGFCNATCPTYQVLGDELDGPRGRIYQIKQFLEGGEVSAHTREHLDRCLSCRACETTCPSGVQYHELLDIGKQALDEALPRPYLAKLKRSVIHATMRRPRLFSLLLSFGRIVRPLLPLSLRQKVPDRSLLELDLDRHAASLIPNMNSTRSILVFGACVQDAITPQVNEATHIVFRALGFEVESLNQISSACCGALSQHTDQQALAKAQAKKNIDAWLPIVEKTGAEAIVANASGCGVFLKDYPELFEANDPYHEKALRLSSLCKDPVELLQTEAESARLKALVSQHALDGLALAYHPPCTLQHGQSVNGVVESVFASMGIKLLVPTDAHLCCGSAGTYALLQSELSNALRDNKLEKLGALRPDLILTSNIGCQSHLAAQSQVPVVHWLQYLAQLLTMSTKL